MALIVCESTLAWGSLVYVRDGTLLFHCHPSLSHAPKAVMWRNRWPTPVFNLFSGFGLEGDAMGQRVHSSPASSASLGWKMDNTLDSRLGPIWKDWGDGTTHFISGYLRLGIGQMMSNLCVTNLQFWRASWNALAVHVWFQQAWPMFHYFLLKKLARPMFHNVWFQQANLPSVLLFFI